MRKDVAVMFGPQWQEIVALVRSIASITEQQTEDILVAQSAARYAERREARRAAWGALAAAVVGVLCTAISWGTRPEFRVREHIFPINVLYNIHLSIDRWHQSLAYPETSRSFCFDTRRDSLPAEREIYVYVIGDDDTSSMRPVVLGAADGERVAVREGLKPGERVVLEGLDRLREGSKVEVVTGTTGKDGAEPEA